MTAALPVDIVAALVALMLEPFQAFVAALEALFAAVASGIPHANVVLPAIVLLEVGILLWIAKPWEVQRA